MSELDTLIKEQAQEMRLGDVQHPEPGTVPLSDEMNEVLSNTGIPWQGWKRVRHYPECPLHGRGALSVGYRGTPRCRTCHRESVYGWRKRNPQQFLDIQKKQYHRNKEEINRRRREKYASDPEYRRKRMEAAAKNRERRRAKAD